MPENVGYITQLITDKCCKGLGHTDFGASWCEFVHVFFFLHKLERNVLSQTVFIVRHGSINHGYSASLWTLVHQRCRSVC